MSPPWLLAGREQGLPGGGGQRVGLHHRPGLVWRTGLAVLQGILKSGSPATPGRPLLQTVHPSGPKAPVT